MNSTTAFENAAGVSVTQVATLAIGISAAVIFLFTAWALVSVYRGMAKNRVDMATLQTASLRLFLLLVVILWILL